MYQENLTDKHITEFTTADTVFIPDMKEVARGYSGGTFLCQFIAYDSKKRTITGKVLKAYTNESLYTHKIKEGWELSARADKCSLYGTGHGDGSTRFHYFDSTGYAMHPDDRQLKPENTHTPNHPSYGMIHAHRQTGSTRHLFGSAIAHGESIVITIGNAEHERTLSNDYYHRKGVMIEVELSSYQFAEFITSLNIGTGVPCTIRYKDGERIPDPPFTSHQDIFNEEFKKKMENLSVKLKSTVRKATQILEGNKPITKAERSEIASSISMLMQEIGSNVPFVAQQFGEEMQKTTTVAKMEVEAFIQNRVTQLGLENVSKLRGMLGDGKKDHK